MTRNGARIGWKRAFGVALAFAVALAASPVAAQFTQQGSKLTGSSATGAATQGQAVALSADGNTMIVGGGADGGNAGAAWVFVRSNGAWTQQGAKLVGTDASADAALGTSVALSADGNTAAVGGPADSSGAGAVWIFTR